MANPLRRFTEAQLAEFHERDERRKKLEKEARQLDAANKTFAEELKAALLEAQQNTMVRGAFRASVIAGNTYVAWKDEFLKACGPEAAARLVEAASASQRLVIAPEAAA